MLTIREEQMKAFEQDALRRFDDEMMLHCKEFQPQHCQILGDEQLRLIICQAKERANLYGFTNRGPIRLYIELMFLFGSDFDTDPQYPALGEVLRTEEDQMFRAEKIYEIIVDYQQNVPALDANKVAKTLSRVTGSANKQKKDSPKHFPKNLSEELGQLFPEKTARLGRENLIALIDAGKKESKKYDLGNEDPLLVILMFLFGHGCTRDPLFPWISHTLQDKLLTDAIARAGQLEKRTLKWLEQVLATPQKGEQ